MAHQANHNDTALPQQVTNKDQTRMEANKALNNRERDAPLMIRTKTESVKTAVETKDQNVQCSQSSPSRENDEYASEQQGEDEDEGEEEDFSKVCGPPRLLPLVRDRYASFIRWI